MAALDRVQTLLQRYSKCRELHELAKHEAELPCIFGSLTLITIMSLVRIRFPAAAAFFCCLTAQAFAPPPILVTADSYSTWCASNHVKVYADPSGNQLVEFTVLIEKPKPRDVYWNLNLTIFEGTNHLAGVSLGDDLVNPETWSLAGNKEYAGKHVQRFSFILNSELISNSVISFVQLKRPAGFPAGTYSSVYIVSVRDMNRHFNPTVSQGHESFQDNSHRQPK